MRQIFASRLVAMALSCALLGGLACSSGGSGTGGMGTGGSGSGGSGTGGTVSDAGSGGADAATDAPRDGGDAAGDGSTGALTFKSTTRGLMGDNLAFPASASAPMNQSPALAWDGVPAGTMSFAISMFDATMRNTHWILWDIPMSTMMLPANLPRGAMPATPAGAT